MGRKRTTTEPPGHNDEKLTKWRENNIKRDRRFKEKRLSRYTNEKKKT